jgi:hypothetical protein
MDRWRLFVTIALPFVSLLLKWVAVTFRRGYRDKVFGQPIAPFPLARHFRLVGWDMAGASMGIFTVALVSEATTFGKAQEVMGEFRNLGTIAVFVVFLGTYCSSAICRYVTLETAESMSKNRWRWAAVSWLLGSLMLVFSSALAMRGPDDGS